MNSLQPKIVVIIQARMGSERLPGKSLSDVHGKPLLQRVVERAQACRRVASVMVATTVAPPDEAIADFCRERGIACYRGSENDVLDRYYRAAVAAEAAVVVRYTADDPFKDPEVTDLMIEHLLAHPELDYASNTIRPTYPEGVDVEVFTFAALERAWREACLASEREHVTPYIWKNAGKFQVANIECAEDLSRLRWTIDYEADLAFARAVYERLDARGVFVMRDILALLQAEPELASLNQGFQRNLGYLKSVQQDRITR